MTLKKRFLDLGTKIHKKVLEGSEMLQPKHKWMDSKTEKDCDVVMLMSPSAEIGSINWLHLTLTKHMPQLKVTIKQNEAVKSTSFHIQATFEGLVQGGEELRLMKRTKKEFGGDLKEFSQIELSLFQNSEDQETFFTTEERQRIVLYILNSFRAPIDDSSHGAFVRKGQAVVSKFLSKGVIKELYPLHDYERRRALKSKWVRGIWATQPIDDIRDYFGSQIALYFAWLEHYTLALTIPAFLGLIFWTMEDNARRGLVTFACLNVVWTSGWLEAWKRRSAEIAHTWGNLDAQLNRFSEPRPHFKGELKVSKVTGRLEPYYPAWRRYTFRYLVSLPLILTSMYVVFRVMLITLEIQETLKQAFIDANLEFLSAISKALMAIPISISNKLYTRMAHWLTKKENYRTEEDHQNQLIMKLLMFWFVNSFMSLFYIAFYLQDVERLREQLAAFLLTKQLKGNFKESIVPYLKTRLKLSKMSHKRVLDCKKKEKNSDDEDSDDETSKEHLLKDGDNLTKDSKDSKDIRIPQSEVESKMKKYEGTYKDCLEVFTQFGYITLFSSAFPLAAVFALVGNIVELRTDAFKMCYVFQRPFGKRTQSIGIWQNAMEFMGIISIVVNCALIGISGQLEILYPDLTTNQMIIFIILLEHVLIGLKYTIGCSINDVPEWVEEEISRKEYLRREALKKSSLLELKSQLQESTPLASS